MRLLLTRHGHVDGIDPARFRGRQELALTQRGQVEAQLLARRISTGWLVDAVFCSPMGRCIETARAIADTRGLTPTVLPQLNDIDYGDWQFKTHDEIRRTDRRTLDTWFKAPHKVRFPRGESLQDVAVRTADALRVLFTKHADDVVVIVAHDSTNRVMLTELLDMPLSAYWRFEQTPCCVNEIDMMPDAIRLLSMNDTAHLAAIETDTSNTGTPCTIAGATDWRSRR